MKRKNKTIPVLLVASFLNVFGWALITPLYALYAIQLGASPQSATLIWSFYTLLAGTLMILLGWAEDYIKNRRRLLIVGYAVESLGVGVLVCAPDTTWLAWGLGVYAVGMGIVTPIWKVMFATSERKGREAASWGFFHGVNTLLISAAAAISGLLFATSGFKGILYLMVAIHVSAMMVSLGIRDK